MEVVKKKDAPTIINSAEKAQIAEGKRIEAEGRDRAEFERNAKEKAEAQAKRQAEQEKQRIEKEKAEAEAEAKRVEALKPDKEKLLAFANMLIEIERPHVSSDEVKKTVREIIGRINGIALFIQEYTEKM